MTNRLDRDTLGDVSNLNGNALEGLIWSELKKAEILRSRLLNQDCLGFSGCAYDVENNLADYQEQVVRGDLNEPFARQNLAFDGLKFDMSFHYQHNDEAANCKFAYTCGLLGHSIVIGSLVRLEEVNPTLYKNLQTLYTELHRRCGADQLPDFSLKE